MKPEEKARQTIDGLLTAAGWVIQDKDQINLGAGDGVAVREFPVDEGFADYLLFVNRKPVGVIEAKKEGTTLSTVAEQSAIYGSSLPEFFRVEGKLPFYYESTGVETFFRDTRDPEPRSRRLFTFHRPETLGEWAAQADTLRARLACMASAHPLATAGMRDCQVEAIHSLERSMAADKPRALIQMATGAGKTFTACAAVYRLIKYGGAKRVLFLVDRANLGRQAKGEFDQFVVPDSGRKFTELYNVQHLTSSRIDPVARVTICTIQRLYSLLRGEELEEDFDEKSGFELAAADGRPREVAYNPAIPIEAFDFVITDECHRSIYNLWRQVLEYFDAHLVGLTATPSKQTIGFFNQNLVTEYNHERAVADGVNVGYDVYRIKTQVTQEGGKVEKGLFVDKRSKETRARRWERLDEELAYQGSDLDRSVVVPSQIRTVLQAFKDALATDLFPGRTMVPKTLIFAKDDSHAEDVVHLCREVFGKGNDFCKKITYKAYNPETKRYEKSESLIQEFRTSPQLRIAVTVDMIATGTDIKPLECLLFLRDVRSRVYFEQMKGRGTRVLSPTDLQSVSGADARAKTHFVIVDAVGVCESDKTDSRPLERKPGVAFDKLLLGVAMGKRDEDSLTTLAGRLARIDRELSPEQRRELSDLAGKPLSAISGELLRAVDPDCVEAASRRLSSDQSALSQFFDPLAPVEFLTGDLPHWRQEGVTYFVTFRLVDSLPEERLSEWREERDRWLAAHPRPLSDADEAEYQSRFSARIESWLDQGAGSCILAIPECRQIVVTALRHFDGERYALGVFAIASNHVHVLVTPKPGHTLSEILHSWKSFTAKEILRVEAVEAASRRLTSDHRVWQKESFDHIVRDAVSLAKIEEYIRGHEGMATKNLEELRRDAAATACAPFDRPEFREALVRVKQLNEQTIDAVTVDSVLAQGYDAAAREKAAGLVTSFRDYIEQHHAEIAALQILYSRPFKQRLTEPLLKALEKNLREHHAAWTEDRLWDAYAATRPEKVKGRSQAGRFADLVALVRFALERQSVLEPFRDTVEERFANWLRVRGSGGSSGSGVPPLEVNKDKRRDAASTTPFTPEQLEWLRLIKDHIATSLAIEPDDFDYAPFSQRGGLGKAHQLFGEELPVLLEELNEVLAA